MRQLEQLGYGDRPDQHLELVRADAPVGLAVLVHGGYWREAFTLDLMRGLAQSLAAAGWDVVNVEYRRGPQAVWPAPLDDVVAACALARSLRRTGPLVVVGHSVGGQLALLAGARADAVVALAPVTDAARTHREGLGDDAAAEYFRCGPEDAPALFRSASPVALLAADMPRTLVVHGSDDDRVPVRHTVDYAAAAWDAGCPLDLVLPGRLGHREAINPTAACWPQIHAWLAGLYAGTLSTPSA